MFSLADLFVKVIANRWQGSLVVLGGKGLTAECCEKALVLLNEEEVDFRPGDRVVVRTRSEIEAVAFILAAWNLGLVIVPVKGDISPSAVERLASDCNAKAIWQDGNLTDLQSYRSERTKFKISTPTRVTGVDLALIVYTSGSTGKPKGIMLTHQNILTSLDSICQYLSLTDSDRVLCLSPLSFDYGLYQVLFALYMDCTTILYDKPFNPIQALKVISSHRVSVLPIVPAMGAALVKLISLVKPDLSELRSITNTGGHLSEYVVRSWKESCPNLKIYSMYGLTECKRALYLEPELWEEKIGSVGRPIPGLDARIFLQDGDAMTYREAEVAEIGELYVRGAAIMQSYYDVTAQGGAKIVPGIYRDDNWLATGDLFTRDVDGFLYFKGRLKDLIKQAGFCLFPKELENHIDSCSLVHLNVIVGSQDRFENEIAVCVVELHENTEGYQKQFRTWLKDNLDSDYTPREIKFVEIMQLTANSKVDRKRIEEELQA
ncbi:fatty acid--CoA ligase family protein [Microbulbifer sp. OS29]|uniref:Fatty acid--CoA ligase family protein n=1 Tax=Microbulbifer okhotskensis TaxID=2926617 RepID=A0A9X2EP50_9GAMM|nr:fatty acid--CoA ligase family protein [Microbulbifer okhotskensis]MCO1334745.1 fatty acid--CoA ligase family protein [Microbulbifer okhotskensis]